MNEIYISNLPKSKVVCSANDILSDVNKLILDFHRGLVSDHFC